MAAEIGIVGSVIGVTTAAYASCKAVYELVQGMRDTPRQFELLRTELNEVIRVLDTFQNELYKESENRITTGHTTGLRASLNQISPCITELKKGCDEFKGKLDKVFAHSTQDRTSKRDRFAFQFQEKNIAAFRYRLATYKDTISIALGLATLTATSSNARDAKSLEKTVETVSMSLASQIKGMEISLQTLVDSGLSTTNAHNSAAMEAIEQQKLMLEKCLKFCVAASAGTAAVTGNHVHFAKVQDEAKQLVGNIGNVQEGGPAVVIGNLIAEGKSRQMAGTVAGDVALKFME